MPRPPERFGNQPSLDGLRAISVLAVVAYHAGATWMTGGFYGVEVFFVVSGFLITSLLLDERERSGRIDLKQFWIRRGRRLLPALVVMLVAVATWAWMFGSSEQQSSLRRDLPWGVGYLANWGQIVGKVPYYAATDPPLLRHLWSLAVEEQWYLLWPLAFAGMAALGWSMRGRAKLLAGTFIAIWIGMIVVSGGFGRPITLPFLGTIDRTNLLYLSSLTRASGLLLGAAAAFVWRPWRAARPERQRQLTGLECVGAGALTLLVLTFTAAHLAEAATFRWILPSVSVLSTIVVCVAVHPGAPTLRRLLGTPWLVAVGRRSYGIYLWHWPIFVFCGVQGGAAWRVALALCLTVVASELCYRYVETPIRTGTWRQVLAESRGQPSPSLGASTMMIALPVLLVGALVVHYSAVRPFDRAAGGQDVQFAAAAAPDPTVQAGAAVVATPTTAAATADSAVRVTVVGDSMAHALVLNRPKGLSSTLEVSDGSIDGCDVFDSGTAVSSTGFELGLGQCRDWASRWARAAGSHQADIALVVIGAWDVLDVIRPDGSRLAFGTPAFDAAYLAQLQQGIDALSASGIKVALLEVACMRPVQAKGAATPPLPERADDRRVTHLSALLRTAAERNPTTTAFVSGPPEWCNGSPIASDLGYRWDGVHVYKPGANLIFRTITPALTALAA